MPTQKDYVKTALRMPPALHQALHGAAIDADRTFNAEILHRLRSTFTAQRDLQPVTLKGQQ